MKKILIFVLTTALLLPGCDVLMQGLQTMQSATMPSQTEVVNGLKQALQYGVDFAVNQLHKKDGYYGNQLVKILLPDNVQNAINYALNNPTVKKLGLDRVLKQKVDQVVLSINRSAEAAAIEAKPIFVNAVKNLTIVDGYNILKGQDPRHKVAGFDSLAATHYLELKTRSQLFNLYLPKMNQALNKNLGLGFSANQAWNTLVRYYNNYVATVLHKPKINYTLAEYATNKALDGLFTMIGQEEKKIRRNPYQWSSDLIKKVFGYVYKP